MCGALRKKKVKAATLLRELGARDDILTFAAVGDVDAVARLLDEEPELVDVADPADDLFGHTPLYHSLHSGQRNAALLLLGSAAPTSATAAIS